MTKERFEIDLTELKLNRLEKKDYEETSKFKKYHIKITMIKPYEILDYWLKKPDMSSIMEVFMDELTRSDLAEHFKFEVHQV